MILLLLPSKVALVSRIRQMPTDLCLPGRGRTAPGSAAHVQPSPDGDIMLMPHGRDHWFQAGAWCADYALPAPEAGGRPRWPLR